MQEFSFKSASTPGLVYKTRLNDNGSLTCDCPGWVKPRVGKPRLCKHIKQVASDKGVEIVERDRLMWVAGSVAPATPAQAATVAADAPKAEKVAAQTARGFVEPMLASSMPQGKTADDFGSDKYVMDEKYDGVRLIVTVTHAVAGDIGRVEAWSRGANTWSSKLPKHIVATMAKMPDGTYDGELIFPGGHSYDVMKDANASNLVFVIFDVLEVLGRDVKRESQDTRRALLNIAYKHIEGATVVILSEQQAPSVRAVKVIWERGGEGAIIKTRSAKYLPGYRSGDWVKVKAKAHATVTITGFDEGKSGPYSTTVGVDDGGVEMRVKTLDNDTLRAIAKDPASFIGKRLVVEFQERTTTDAKKARHPMWDHLAGEKE